MSANVTVTDLFCGAGGSSSGAAQVPGVKVRLAANHWRLAVDTHNTNHPDADHDCADLSQVRPQRYPKTDILWASPECTNHTGAKGKKPTDGAQPDLFGETLPDEAAERSRATMWDVPRFAEHHHYRAIIVENVVEAARWVMWPAWVHAMGCLGYEIEVVYLNSMHAQAMGLPAPQSRDRMYAVLWKKGERRPDLTKFTRPQAWCETCAVPVRAVQAWKNPDKKWGRYKQQYVWRCPNVACRNAVVEPGFLPASYAIDWSLRGERIGDRVRPLADKTRARIAAGLKRYAVPAEALVVPVEGREGKEAQPASWALRTQTTRAETGVAIPPFIAELRGGHSETRPIDDPLATFTASGNHHGLVVPYYGNGYPRTTEEPHGTFTTRDRFALIMRNNGGTESGWHTTPASEPLKTLTTAGHQSLIHGSVPDVDDCLFRMLEPHEVQVGMAFDREYVVLGNKRERVRQLGNAVTPPAARDLIAAVTEALTGESVAVA